MRIGIIGGSGLDDPKLLEDYEEKEVETPYGKPSSLITCGKIFGVEVCILARHGKKHTIPPSQVNYRANIYALAKLGCKYILATTAVGSLREEIKRKDFVILDQFIDFTKHRKTTFFEEFKEKPVHVSLAEPFSEFLRQKIIKSCEELNIPFHKKGTVITIEGPRFSTRAESNLFRQWGADVINMSIAPEAILAKEAGLEYAAIAMSTDYDCWKQDEEPVSWDQILKILNENVENMKKLLLRVIEKLGKQEQENEDIEFIKSKIRTIPNFPKPGIMFRDITTLLKEPQAMKKVLEILYEKYKDKNIDTISAIESRGFIFGSLLAEKLNTKLVPVRKQGKLPAETLREEYELEYGKDAVEIHKDAIQPGDNVLVLDDLIATGGTALATCKLIEKLGGRVVGVGFVIELPDLKGREKLAKEGYDVFSIVKFEGE